MVAADILDSPMLLVHLLASILPGGAERLHFADSNMDFEPELVIAVLLVQAPIFHSQGFCHLEEHFSRSTACWFNHSDLKSLRVVPQVSKKDIQMPWTSHATIHS